MATRNLTATFTNAAGNTVHIFPKVVSGRAAIIARTTHRQENGRVRTKNNVRFYSNSSQEGKLAAFNETVAHYQGINS